MLKAKFIVPVALGLFAPSAFAQFSIDWYTIDGGGGDSSGASFVLSGTIGQPDAGVMSGGAFSLSGGFWHGSTTTPPPGCDPDYDQNGVADQDDVSYLINVIGGGDNPTGRDPDFDCNGVGDQDDISALINVVAGGDCPC